MPFTEIQLLALLIQNKITPKNSHRTDLIKSGKYNQLRTEDEAIDWLRVQLKEMFNNLYHEYTNDKSALDRLAGVEKKAKVFASTECQEVAAACIYKSYIGQGDFVQFYDALCKGEHIPLAAFKLSLLINPVFNNIWLLKDKHREDKKDKDFVIKQNMAFHVWKNLCIKTKSLTEQELVALFPESAEKLQWWKRYNDESGNQKFSQTQEERDKKRDKNIEKRKKWRLKKKEQKKLAQKAMN